MAVEYNHATVMVFHFPIGVPHGRLSSRCQFEHRATSPVPRSCEDHPVIKQRHRTIGGSVGRGIEAPKRIEVAGTNGNHTRMDKVHDHSFPAEFDQDWRCIRRLGRSICQELPQTASRQFVEGHDCGLLAAGAANELLSIDQYRFADSPLDVAAAVVPQDVLLPDNLPLIDADTDQVATGSQGIDAIPIHGGCTTRPVSLAPVCVLRPTCFGGPKRLAGGSLHRQHYFVVALVPHRKDLAVGDGNRGIPFAEFLLFPYQIRSTSRPFVKQT